MQPLAARIQLWREPSLGCTSGHIRAGGRDRFMQPAEGTQCLANSRESAEAWTFLLPQVAWNMSKKRKDGI